MKMFNNHCVVGWTNLQLFCQRRWLPVEDGVSCQCWGVVGESMHMVRGGCVVEDRWEGRGGEGV